MTTIPVLPPARRSLTAARLLGLLLALGALLLVVMLSIAVGAKPIPLSGVISALFHGQGTVNGVVVLDLRLPRTLLGIGIGAALGLAGCLMQALTRNPLADPGILGVNIGASVTVVLAIWIWRFTDLTAYVSRSPIFVAYPPTAGQAPSGFPLDARLRGGPMD
jgi:iron complex transport system permease protein